MAREISHSSLYSPITDAIHSGNLTFLKKLVDEIFPFYSEGGQKGLIKKMCVEGYSCDFPDIVEYCAGFMGITEDSAYNYIRSVIDKPSEANPEKLSESIAALGTYKSSAIFYAIDKLGKDKGKDISSIIERIIDDCPDVEGQKDRWDSYTKRHFFGSSLDVSLLQRINAYARNIQSPQSRKYFIDALFGSNGEVVCKQKLDFEKIPVIEYGVMNRPEVYLAILENKFFPITKNLELPVCVRDDEYIPGSVDAHEQFVRRPAFEFKQYTKQMQKFSDDFSNYLSVELLASKSKIMFSAGKLSLDNIAAFSDESIMTGIGIPKGYRLQLMSMDQLSCLSIGQVDTDKMESARDFSKNIAVPEKSNAGELFGTRSEQSKQTFMSPSDFVNTLKTSTSFYLALKKSGHCTTENMYLIANSFADGHVDLGKPSKRYVYDDMNRSISYMHEIFGVLPSGNIALVSNESVDVLFNSGVKVKLESGLSFYNDLPKSIYETFNQETYNKIADMGDSVCIKGMIPETAQEAITFAGKKTSQPMYTGLLRQYDFDELCKLAKKEAEWDCLLKAYPDRQEQLKPFVSKGVLGKIFEDSLGF